MESYSRVGHPRDRIAAMLTTLIIIAAAILAPAAAEASTYIWNSPNSGSWTNPANWQRTEGPLGLGYPSNPGDVASFTRPFGDAIIITIPAATTVTVGSIFVNTDHLIHIVAPSGGRLIIDNNGPSTPAILAAHTTTNLTAPIQLRSPLAVVTQHPLTSISIGRIEESGGQQVLIKSGPGRLTFGEPCTYTGATVVQEGTAVLTASNRIVRGDLVIGDGQGAARSAVVQIFGAGDQIADDRGVFVSVDGQLVMRSQIPERIGDLVVNDGAVDFSHPDAGGVLTMRSLSMTGGRLEATESGMFVFDGPVTAASSAAGPALLRFAPSAGGNGGTINLLSTTRTFTVNDGPAVVDLEIDLPIFGSGLAGIVKDGAGTMRFKGSVSNTYPGTTEVRRGRLELASFSTAVPRDLVIGGSSPAEVLLTRNNTIASGAAVTVAADSLLTGSAVSQTVNSLSINNSGRVQFGSVAGFGTLSASSLFMTGGRLTLQGFGRFELSGSLLASSTSAQPATIDGNGSFALTTADHFIATTDGPQTIDLRLDARITGAAAARLFKAGTGVAQFGGTSTYAGATIVNEGALTVSGSFPASTLTVAGGVLSGTGTVGAVKGDVGGTIAPGPLPGASGRLLSGSVLFVAGAAFVVELSPTPTADQLAVAGTVNLSNSTLVVTAGNATASSFTIIENDGTDNVISNFTGLPQGATVTSTDGRTFTISYFGGNGNDVVLTAAPAQTFFLTTSATGDVVDDQIAIANLNTADAPISVTFLHEGGRTIVEHRTVPAHTRQTLDVARIPGLEDATISVQVTSTNGLPLVVERTTFQDAATGHTTAAVTQPERQWVFAEGDQGLFDTSLLITNTNARPTMATITFLREGDAPIVKQVPVGPFTRKTVSAADYPDVAGRAFGIIVDATQPVFAARAMDFAPLPDGTRAGRTVTTGSAAPSASWVHADAATGDDVNTFILLSNPQQTAAHVKLRYLSSTGETITRTATVEAQQRLTVDLTKDVAGLDRAAVSTVVQADVPIVSERSTYWAGKAKGAGFGEGLTSAGAAKTGTRWGFAEGRIGGSREFETFLLFANPSTRAAQVTVTYLPEGGAPIERTYAVPASSHYRVDVTSLVPELRDASFGARVEVTNGVPVAVERSMYWNADGQIRAGGANAVATPLP